MPDMASRVVADIGGTTTRLAVYDERSSDLHHLATYTNNEYSGPEQIIEHWLGDLGETAPSSCCFAVAATPMGDQVNMVNIGWSFSCAELGRRFSFSRMGWVNDFQANAHALPYLGATDREVLQQGQPREGAGLATMGPGTGLGGATLEWIAGQPHARDSEPGHAGLSPATRLELEIFRLLLPRHGNIHAELLVSGAGIVRLYQAVSELRGEPIQELAPADITSRALVGSDDSCVLALQIFCALLGSACGDYVLSNGAYGGLYLAGGIVPRMIPFLRSSSFLQRFRHKGAMTGIMEEIPLYVITAPQPGLLGAGHAPLHPA